MIFGAIVEFAVGALCIILGLIIWLKQKISLVHDYHYKNVKKADVPAYCRLLGIGLIIIGAGIAVTGVFNLFESPLWWIPITIGFAAGLFIMHKAQMKYNGSWFG